MNSIFKLSAVALMLMLSACGGGKKEMKSEVRLITLDPGHFHAALVQKSMYPQVDSTAYVYAPGGQGDVDAHLSRIDSYNGRKDHPTRWTEEVYRGPDFLERMLAEKKGNVVVLSGNNLKKTEYITQSVNAGFHVLADKPMVITRKQFDELKSAFAKAAANKTLLYDIMTERFEITNLLQRELSMIPEIFGNLEKGTAEAPAVTKESVHHFFKFVSGQPLIRPAWFLDTQQQGEGLTDITTHLIDLIQWECFPNQAIDYSQDIELVHARRWPTEITRSQFATITKKDQFPDFLQKDLSRDSILKVFSNGEIIYKIRGVFSRVSVTWAFKAPDGTGDTHQSIMKGSLSNLIIRQGQPQGFKPTLYIESSKSEDPAFANTVENQFKVLEIRFPGIKLKKTKGGWEVVIPDSYKEGHEAHFARVTENFLRYLEEGNLPSWEVPNMLAKYYTTTSALEWAKSHPDKN